MAKKVTLLCDVLVLFFFIPCSPKALKSCLDKSTRETVASVLVPSKC